MAEGGISRSDPVAQPVTPSRSVADLHALLEAAGQTGPFVLAAHSYGGLVARLFAHQYPDDVAGMVLVDSFSPELREAMPDLWPSWIAWNTTPAEIIEDYPDYERVDFDAALDEVVGEPVHPADAAGRAHRGQAVPGADASPGSPPTSTRRPVKPRTSPSVRWRQLVPGAEHITKTDSGHDIMLENPVLVSDAIVDVIAAVRDGRTSIS